MSPIVWGEMLQEAEAAAAAAADDEVADDEVVPLSWRQTHTLET